MIAAPVQCYVDGIPKGSHYVRVPIAIGWPNVDYTEPDLHEEMVNSCVAITYPFIGTDSCVMQEEFLIFGTRSA
jgi:hypothetical protein